MNFPLKKVVILGVGMIGASFGLALKKTGIAAKIVGCGRTVKNLQSAVEIGAIDAFDRDPASAVSGADFIMIAAHNAAVEDLLKKIAPHLSSGAVVTDAGSVKEPIVKLGESLVPDGCYFIGGHPIAGKEKSGAVNASDDLYNGARCILTPTENSDPGALALVRKVWEEIGSSLIEMPPDKHDRILAAISHLPHVAAYALVNTVGELGKTDGEVMLFPAGGFGDITRIASSNPEMWRDICLMNNKAIINVIEELVSQLTNIKDLISSQGGEALLNEFLDAKKIRETILIHGRPGG